MPPGTGITEAMFPTPEMNSASMRPRCESSGSARSMNQLMKRYITQMPIVVARNRNLFLMWAILAMPIPRLRINCALVLKNSFLCSNLIVRTKYPTRIAITSRAIHQREKLIFSFSGAISWLEKKSPKKLHPDASAIMKITIIANTSQTLSHTIVPSALSVLILCVLTYPHLKNSPTPGRTMLATLLMFMAFHTDILLMSGSNCRRRIRQRSSLKTSARTEAAKNNATYPQRVCFISDRKAAQSTLLKAKYKSTAARMNDSEYLIALFALLFIVRKFMLFL